MPCKPLTNDQRQRYWRSIYANPEGKAAIDDLLADAGLLRGAFNRDNDRLTAYNLGRQSVALQLYDCIHGEMKDATR